MPASNSAETAPPRAHNFKALWRWSLVVLIASLVVWVISSLTIRSPQLDTEAELLEPALASDTGSLAALGSAYASMGNAAGAAALAPAAQPSQAPVSGPLAITAQRERRAAIGRQVFFDASLSEPAGTSCASCHDPSQAFSGNHGSKLGVALGSRPGHYARRNTPSVMYMKYVRSFHWHWEEDAPVPDAVGGFFWDGRVNTLTDLTRQPLLNPDEMGNTSPQQLVDKARRASYADALAAEYGVHWDDADGVLHGLGAAVEAYLTSDELTPFTSRYDDFVRGKAQLSPQEMRGLSLFRDGAKGGCDGCHRMNDASPNPERSLFTDYGYEILAVPRNRKLPQNRKAKYFDLGLCESTGLHFPMDRETWCGAFKTPSLRNVAVRKNYMHNGAFTSLRDVVAFYATRGTKPQRWYKSGVQFDDLPVSFRDQVPFERVPYDRREGQKPRLNDLEIDDIVAFLQTLTDAAYR